jgi:hypothetical protein
MVSYFNHLGIRVSGPETSTEFIDPTTVGDVSKTRTHRAWPAAADAEPVLAALRAFLFSLHPTASGEGLALSDAMQTAYRVTFNASGVEDGDPGPEGVHQDSADLTAITLIGRDNVLGGANRVWTLDQPCGKSSHHDVASGRLLLECTLLEPLDTLIVCDRMVKHEATSIAPEILSEKAVRDVLTYEIRRGPFGGRSLT